MVIISGLSLAFLYLDTILTATISNTFDDFAFYSTCTYKILIKSSYFAK